VFQQLYLKAQGFIQQINNVMQFTSHIMRLWCVATLKRFDTHDMLYGESPSGAYREPLRRRARGVAFALVGLLSFGIAPADGISNVQYYDLKSLADYQLTDKQFHCHNRITFLESSNNRTAVNGSHYGYYQMRNRLLKDSPYDYQFYMYWKYVSHRYGVTEYDEPNYCKALNHLIRKGWQ
jgi:hypothetical protein